MAEPRFRVTTAYGATYDDPSPELLHRLLTEATEERPFVVLDRLGSAPLVPEGAKRPASEGHFIQTYYWDDATGCGVEYREGGAEWHFRTLVPGPLVPEGHRTVAALLQDWAYERPGWRERFAWEPVFSAAEVRRQRVAARLVRLFRGGRRDG